ncbi:MAG: hypothetical protein EBZ67_05985 [Chitinophagia bacterium]|nr:hypothetical protein [Chitinophagia bacterium]
MRFPLQDILPDYALPAFVLLLLLVPYLLNRFRRKRTEGDQGMPAPTAAADPYETPSQSSITTLEGSQDGISWTLTSSVTVTEQDDGTRSVAGRLTRWECRNVGLPQGQYILMQAHPKPVDVRPEGGQGFFGRIARKLGEMAVDVYVSAYFGDGFAELVNLDGSETVAVDGIPSYFIRSNTPAATRRFLNGPVKDRIRAWKEQTQGFDHEEEVDLLGILVHDKGVTAGCMTSMGSEEEARKLASFMADFTAALRSSGIGRPNAT